MPSLLVYRSLGQFALPEGAADVLGGEPATDGAAATGLAAVMRVFVHGLCAAAGAASGTGWPPGSLKVKLRIIGTDQNGSAV